MVKFSNAANRFWDNVIELSSRYTNNRYDQFSIFLGTLRDSRFVKALKNLLGVTTLNVEELRKLILLESKCPVFYGEYKVPKYSNNLDQTLNDFMDTIGPKLTSSGNYGFSSEFLEVIDKLFKDSKYSDTAITIKDIVDAFFVKIDPRVAKAINDIGTTPNKLWQEYSDIVECEPDEEDSYVYETNYLIIPDELEGIIEVLNEKHEEGDTCPILGRENECKEVWKTLMKQTKRNVILVGKPGVGKSAIVEKMTYDILNGKCPDMFGEFKLVSLNVNSLIAGTTYRGQAEERFEQLIDFLTINDDVILFIDEIHMIVGAGSCSIEDNMDFSNALKPVLAGDIVRVIGATTDEEYQKAFGSNNGALSRRFRKINVREPKLSEVPSILKQTIKNLEEYHGVTISNEMVKFIILNSTCFSYNVANPDRTKDLIDLSMVTAKMDGKKRVDRKSVLKNFDANFENFKKMTVETKYATAYHETGHYLVHECSKSLKDTKATAISIIPTQDYLGITTFERTDNIPNKDTQYYMDDIAVCLAGRVAETMYRKGFNSGACVDIDEATKKAYDFVARYGMSSNVSKNRTFVNQEGYYMQTDKSTDLINEEISRIIENAYNRAEKILIENEKILKKIVTKLVNDGIVSAKEIDEIIAVKNS